MSPTFSLEQLAQHLGAELKGDPACKITRIAPLHKATEGDISFMHNPKYKAQLAQTKASAVMLSPAGALSFEGNCLIMMDPYLGYARVAALFAPQPRRSPGIHPSAVIGQHCHIASTASIGPYCVLGDHVTVGAHTRIEAHCTIGDHSSLGEEGCLYPHVTLYHGVSLGHRFIIHSGAVIGSDGFGMANDQGRWHKIAQLGGVRIGDDVEIGANTTIDRGALEDTIIEEGVKLDNLIQIAHNVFIGAHTAIASGTLIAGSTHIGQYCLIGGGAAIAGHIQLADGVILTAKAEVSNTIKEPGIYSSGMPAQTNQAWRKNIIRFSQLDDLARRLRKLEKAVVG